MTEPFSGTRPSGGVDDRPHQSIPERYRAWMKPHPLCPRPDRIRVFFCNVCGLSCGIEDYDRIRHEHFEQDARCSNGRWDIQTFVREDKS